MMKEIKNNMFMYAIIVMLILGLFATVIFPNIWILLIPHGFELLTYSSVINGLTGPIIGLISAILIYWTIVSQSRLNSYNMVFKTLSDLKNSFDKLEIYSKNGEKKTGVDAVEFFLNEKHKDSHLNFLKRFMVLLLDVNTFIFLFEKSDLGKTQKKALFKLYHSWYTIYLEELNIELEKARDKSKEYKELYMILKTTITRTEENFNKYNN